MKYNMRETENSNSYRGIGFFGLLQVVFIALKVAKVIDWSWWLVFIPAWIQLGIIILLIIILAIIYVIQDVRQR
jgi:uncharacterized membrane protein YdbT with pleckstrin-like domain